jgi:hypothetical protein
MEPRQNAWRALRRCKCGLDAPLLLETVDRGGGLWPTAENSGRSCEPARKGGWWSAGTIWSKAQGPRESGLSDVSKETILVERVSR